jgi:transposase
MLSRFHSVKQAISYCGLCGDEKSSADKVLRTPLSKRRNKHIQRVLIEAAKLGPKLSHELALVYEKENRKVMPIAQRLR